MNSRFPKARYCILLSCLIAAASAPGQLPGTGMGFSASFTKLFGDISAFSSQAEMRVLDSSNRVHLVAPLTFELLDNKIRIQLDSTTVKSSEMSAAAISSLRQMGMAQMISIIRPDTRQIYVIYPEQKSLLKIPLPEEEAAAATKTPNITKTPLGKESIENHPCVKHKVVIKGDKGKTVEATTWNATDMKGFPVQIRSVERGDVSIVRFKQVQFVRPDVKKFEPPAGYTIYTNPMTLMQDALKKNGDNKNLKSQAPNSR